MISNPALKLLHEYPGECLDIHSVADRRDRSRVPITVDPRVELVCTSRCPSPSVWPSAPDDDRPWSNAVVSARLTGFVVELSKLISDQVIRDFAAVVLFNLRYSHQGQEFSDHAAELRKHPQVAPGSPHLLGAGQIKRSRRSAVVHS